MPVQKLRRIGPMTGASLFDQITSQTLHNTDLRRYVDEVERDYAERSTR